MSDNLSILASLAGANFVYFVPEAEKGSKSTSELRSRPVLVAATTIRFAKRAWRLHLLGEAIDFLGCRCIRLCVHNSLLLQKNVICLCIDCGLPRTETKRPRYR